MEISNEWQCDRWAWCYISSYSAPPVWYLCYIEGLCSSLQVALMCDILMICCFTRYLRIGMLKLTVLIRIMPAPSIIQKMILSSFSSTWIGCVIVRILISIKYTHTHTPSNNGVTILQLSSISSNSIVELLVLVFCLCMHSWMSELYVQVLEKCWYMAHVTQG